VETAERQEEAKEVVFYKTGMNKNESQNTGMHPK
jgi:hypothetical protein